MNSKHRTIVAMAALCVAALPFAGANAGTSNSAPLMPTKNPAVHQRLMLQGAAAGDALSNGAVAMTMAPLMATKDRPAHEASPMQRFSWIPPYGVKVSTSGAVIGVEAPLMPTKDPIAHQG